MSDSDSLLGPLFILVFGAFLGGCIVYHTKPVPKFKIGPASIIQDQRVTPSEFGGWWVSADGTNWHYVKQLNSLNNE